MANHLQALQMLRFIGLASQHEGRFGGLRDSAELVGGSPIKVCHLLLQVGDYYWVRKTGGRERNFYTPKGKIVPRGARSPRPRQGLRGFSTEDPEQPEPCFAEDPEHDRQVPVD